MSETQPRASSAITVNDARPVVVPFSTTASISNYQPRLETFVSLEAQREGVRGVLASFLIGVLGIATLGGLALLARDALTLTELRSFTELLVAPLFGIVGTVLGFYFGSQGATGDAKTKPVQIKESKKSLWRRVTGGGE